MADSFDFEALINGTYWFESLLKYLTLNDLVRLGEVCHLFQIATNQEAIWRNVACTLFEGKKFVPCLSKRMITPGNSKSCRFDLEDMDINRLNYLCCSYHIDVQKDWTKSDFVDAIHKFETKRCFSNECLARYAVRIAWLDRKRTTITVDELCNLEWCVRIRGDGPLAWLVDQDPWWQDKGLGKATFDKEGCLSFHFPESHNPFSDFGIPKISYEIECYGNTIKLNIGAQERLARHPNNWGWIMLSCGTVWTGYPTPPRGFDPLTEDTFVERLLVRNPVCGFRLR